MAKLNLNLKLKSNLKKQIEDEDKKSGGNDPRMVNFYDLKDGEKMKVLFVGDVNGELWAKFRKHGPNLKVRGLAGIRCAHESSGVECAACQKGFDFLNQSKEAGDDKSLKDEAKTWFARDYTVMSLLVLESPFEVKESPDKNEVKLMYVPYAIEKIIKEAVTEGVLDEDELCQTPFYIKKTTNQGGYAEYTSSYFARKSVTDEELEYFEDRVVEQFDYSTLDIIPAPTTEEELADWVVKAVAAVEKAANGGKTPQREEREERAPVKKREAPTSARRTPEKNDEIDEDEKHMGEGRKVVDDADDFVDAEPEAPAPTKGGLRDRLANLR